MRWWVERLGDRYRTMASRRSSPAASPTARYRSCCRGRQPCGPPPFLQHEMHVGDGIGLFNQVKQQRRRDVVRQVADQAQLALVVAQAAEVELERIGVVQMKLALSRSVASAESTDRGPVQWRLKPPLRRSRPKSKAPGPDRSRPGAAGADRRSPGCLPITPDRAEPVWPNLFLGGGSRGVLGIRREFQWDCERVDGYAPRGSVG